MADSRKILFIHRGGYISQAIMPVLAEVCARRNWTLREEPTVGEETQALPVSEDLYKEADLIILGRTGRRANGRDWPYTPGIDRYADKVIALDSADGPRRKVVHDCAYYLKREYTGNEWQKRVGAIPFSMCAPRDVVATDPLPWKKRDIDVFIAVCLFSGGIREECVRGVQFDGIMNDRSFIAYGYPGKGKKLPRSKYLNLLRRSKIAIAPRGSGQDTNTYWEIPACGVALLAERRTITILDNFTCGKEALLFNTPRHMVDQYRFALKDQKSLEEMAFAGRAKVLSHHTAEKRVEKMLEVAKPILERE